MSEQSKMESKNITVKYQKACSCPGAKGKWSIDQLIQETRTNVAAMQPPEIWEAPGSEYGLTLTYDPLVRCVECEQPWEAEIEQTGG
jgi:hypothetical protein